METMVRERPLTSNSYTLSAAPERLGWLTPSDPSRPIAELRAQYAAQGYLWLRGLIERDEVLEFRRRYFAAFAQTGLLAQGSDPVDGIYAGTGEDKASVRRIMGEAVMWARYEGFCLSRPIVQFYEELMGGPPYLHKRKLIRYTKPYDAACTGAHYDLTYLRAGTDRLHTSWIPIGDIPVEMGGLIYLEGSDGWGRQLEAEFSIRNADLPPEERLSAFNKNMSESGWLTKDLPSLAERMPGRWLMANYEAGDMVVHSPYMIHASTVNEDAGGRMRLSTDIRFQLVSDQIDPRWGNHWSPTDGI
jgi:ectoine hydroxylase-related dioxygenase (phytanoyl-CoA dioxygenase family)